MLRSRVALLTAVLLVSGRGTGAEAAGPPPPGQWPIDLLPPAPLELRLLTIPVPHSRSALEPWVAVGSEYNDNVLVTTTDHESDFSTVVTGGLTAAWHRPRGGLSLGWAGSARAYARLKTLNDAFDQETVLLGASRRWRPRVSTSLTNLFLLNSRTSVISSAGTFTGGGRSWSNMLTPAVTFRHSQRTTWSGGLTAGVEHFESRPSENFFGRGQAAVDYVCSRRWTGSLGASLDYYDAGRGVAWAPGGRVSANVRLSRRWLASASAGAAWLTSAGQAAKTIACGSAVLQPSLQRGQARLQYDRSLGMAGEYGGPTINETLMLRLALEPHRRWTFALVPAYRVYRSPQGLAGSAIDLRMATADVRIVAPLAGRLDLLGSYSFLRQQEQGREGGQAQVQSRFLVGLRLVPLNSLSALEGDNARTIGYAR